MDTQLDAELRANILVEALPGIFRNITVRPLS